MTPKQSLREAKLISDQMWQFHNDRLSDPTTTDMTPYITPILDNQQRAIQAKLSEIASPHYDNFHKTYDYDGVAEDLLAALSNQIEGDTK